MKKLNIDENIDVIQKLYIFILAIVPIIDSINGYMIRRGDSGTITVGNAYRAILILFMAVLWIKHISKRNFILTSVVIGYMVFACIIQLVFKINDSSFISEMLNVMQWSLIFILFFAYEDLNEAGIIKVENVESIFKIWGIITPLTIVIPYIFGVGYNTYYDTGYKGFYYSTNAITYFLIILYLFSTYELFKKINLFGIIKTGMTAFSLAMLGTKAGYAGLVAAPALCILLKLVPVLKKYKDKKIVISKAMIKKIVISVVSVCAAFTGIVLIFINVYSEQIEKIIGRHRYFFNKSDSLISFITTGRSDRIGTFYSYIKESGHYFLRMIFGNGYGTEKKIGVIEMDYFDALFIFGIIGFVIFILFTVYVFMMRRKQNVLAAFAFLITIGYSLIGGHVWNNAFSTTCFAMVCALMISAKKKKKYRVFIDLSEDE